MGKSKGTISIRAIGALFLAYRDTELRYNKANDLCVELNKDIPVPVVFDNDQDIEQYFAAVEDLEKRREAAHAMFYRLQNDLFSLLGDLTNATLCGVWYRVGGGYFRRTHKLGVEFVTEIELLGATGAAMDQSRKED